MRLSIIREIENNDYESAEERMNKDNGGIPKHSTKYDREMNWEGMKIQ